MDARRLLILAALALAAPSSALGASKPSLGQGPAAIAKAHRAALAPSPQDRLEGGEQIFHFAKGRLYEVWTAPLRVTALSLGVGEEIVSLAAGDSVRWQIAQTSSGSGPQSQAHVLIKPFERGLSTSLVITTSQRVYLLLLRSGDTFIAQVSWTPAPPPMPPPPVAEQAPASAVGAPSEPQMLATAFHIKPRGRRPAWTPSAVMTDGRRTYVAMPLQALSAEIPVLSLIDESGQSALANYRQEGALLIVDGVIGLAELRLGVGRGAQVVRITRLPEGRP